MNVRDAAEDFIRQYEAVISNKSKGTEKDLPELKRLGNLYKVQSYEVRELIGTERGIKLSTFIDEAESEKAERIKKEEVENLSKKLESAVSYKYSGTESDLPKLYEAKRAYDNADYTVKNSIDPNLYSKLSRLIEEGEEEKKKRIKKEEQKRRDDEERRRSSYTSSYSSSSFGSSSSSYRSSSSSNRSSSSFGSYRSSNSSNSHRSSSSSSSSHSNKGMGGGFRGGGSTRSSK